VTGETSDEASDAAGGEFSGKIPAIGGISEKMRIFVIGVSAGNMHMIMKLTKR